MKLINTTKLCWNYYQPDEIKRLTVKEDYSWIRERSWLVNYLWEINRKLFR